MPIQTSTVRPQTATTDDASAQLRKMLLEQYSDEQIVSELLADAEKHGTVGKLLKGKLKFPHPRDARDFTLRKIAERMAPAVEED